MLGGLPLLRSSVNAPRLLCPVQCKSHDTTFLTSLDTYKAWCWYWVQWPPSNHAAPSPARDSALKASSRPSCGGRLVSRLPCSHSPSRAVSAPMPGGSSVSRLPARPSRRSAVSREMDSGRRVRQLPDSCSSWRPAGAGAGITRQDIQFYLNANTRQSLRTAGRVRCAAPLIWPTGHGSTPTVSHPPVARSALPPRPAAR